MMLNDTFSNGGVVSGCFWWYLPPIFCICLSVLGFTLSGYVVLHKDDEHYFSQSGCLNKFISKSNKPEINLEKNNLVFVKKLNVKFQNSDGATLQVLDNINFGIKKNEKIALIGETGSGKIC